MVRVTQWWLSPKEETAMKVGGNPQNSMESLPKETLERDCQRSQLGGDVVPSNN
jgi:hypothetical protein